MQARHHDTIHLMNFLQGWNPIKTRLHGFLVHPQIFSGISFCWSRLRKNCFQCDEIFVIEKYPNLWLKFIDLFILLCLMMEQHQRMSSSWFGNSQREKFLVFYKSFIHELSVLGCYLFYKVITRLFLMLLTSNFN